MLDETDDALDADGTRAFEAVSAGNAEELSELLACGVDIHAVDGDGRSMFSIAIGRGDMECLAALMQAECEDAGLDDIGGTFARTLRKLRPGAPPDSARTGQGDTLLHLAAYACTDGAALLASELIARGADPGAANEKGQTPLHYLARRPVGDGWQAIAISLVEAGADLEAADPDGETPLHFACRCSCSSGQESCSWKQAYMLSSLMLSSGTPIDARNGSGMSAAEIAGQRCGKCAEALEKSVLNHERRELDMASGSGGAPGRKGPRA